MSQKVVFWDFDGTLARRIGMWRGCLISALDQVCARHGVTPEAIRPAMRGGYPWHAPEVDHRHLDTAQRWWSALQDRIVAAYENVGIDADVARAAAALVPDIYVDP